MASSADVATDDFAALAGWLANAWSSYPIAHVAVVGRQGCTREDCAALRDELVAARATIVRSGGTRKQATNVWQNFVTAARAGRHDSTNRPDDVVRAAIVGELDRIRAAIAPIVTKYAALAPNFGALAIGLEWLATGRFDRDRAGELAREIIAKPDDVASSNFERCDVWFAYLAPSDAARKLLVQQQRRAKKARGNDGNSREQTALERAAVSLLSAIVESWDVPAQRAALPDAFRAYYAKSVDFYNVIAPFAATCLEVQLTDPTCDPAATLRRLRELVEPTEPPVPELTDDPGLRALDAIVSVLATDAGLSIAADARTVRCEAKPSVVAGDFI